MCVSFRMERKMHPHFNQKEDEKAECRYCKTIITTKGGGSGNLQRHLKKKDITVDVPSSLPYKRLEQRTGTSRFPSPLVSTGEMCIRDRCQYADSSVCDS